MTIEPQESGETLEDMIEKTNAADDILSSLPAPEPEPEPELEAKPEEETRIAEIGPADYQDSEFVAPKVLAEALIFLNRYGIRTEGLTPKEVMNKIKKIEVAREEHAQVLSRGQALDGLERLLSFVPKGFVGEFKRENNEDIQRAETQGFVVLTCGDANLESPTGTPDDKVRFGDQILMIVPEERYVANRLNKAERLAARRKKQDHKHGRVDQGKGHEGASPLVPLIKL